MALKLNTQERTDTKKSKAKQLRNQGDVPGIVYGKKLKSTTISVSEKELIALLKEDPNVIIDMDVPNEGQATVMVSSMQRDKLTRQILHIDFIQVDMKQEISTNVKLEFEGEPVGVKDEDGILQVESREVEVQCLPDDIPNQIVVNISGMHVGDSLTVGDIKIPKKVTLVSDENDIIVNVLHQQKAEEEETEATETEEAKEPESATEDATAKEEK